MMTNMQYGLVLLGFMAVSGAHAQCDQSASLDCVTAVTDVLSSSAGDLERVCGAFENFITCVANAGCADQLEQLEASLGPVKEQCGSGGSGPAGSCNTTAIQVCIEPFTELGENPTAEQIDAMCQAVTSLEGCFNDAGCSAQYATYSQNFEQAVSQCTPSEGSSCSIGQAYACLAKVDPGETTDSDAECRAFGVVEGCLEELGCGFEVFDSADAAITENINTLKEQCSGAAINAVSVVMLLAALFAFLL